MKTQISYRSQGNTATIMMEAPEGKPPTMDGEVLAALESSIEQARQDMPRVVFVRSSSERFFCVGANINVLKETDAESIGPWVRKGHRVLNQLEDLPMPVIAVVEGYAMGGGLELALACDLIFTSSTARFAQSEAGLGFITGWGASRRLPRRVGAANAKLLFYSGKLLTAPEAADMGLVDFVGEKSDLETELEVFAEKVTGNSQNAIGQFKAIINNQERSARTENEEEEASKSKSCIQNSDTIRRLSDFLNKKKS